MASKVVVTGESLPPAVTIRSRKCLTRRCQSVSSPNWNRCSAGNPSWIPRGRTLILNVSILNNYRPWVNAPSRRIRF